MEVAAAPCEERRHQRYQFNVSRSLLCVLVDYLMSPGRFNKTQEHFPTLKGYNDYLEEVEDTTFNLIEGIEVDEIEEKIARYQQENAEQIYLSRAKQAEALAAALKASRMNPLKAEANDMRSKKTTRSPSTGDGASCSGRRMWSTCVM